MSQPIFSGRVTITNSATVSSDTFDVQMDFFDGTGLFSGNDAGIGNVIFLDTFASLNAPNTVSKYRVTQINSASFGAFDLRLQFIDDGTPVDPSEVIGSYGYISESSDNKSLVFHAAPTIHNFPDYIVQYARNEESISIVDNSFFRRQEFTLSPTDITNKYVELAFVPKPVTSILLILAGAPPQLLDVDYELINDGNGDAKRISWDGMGIDTEALVIATDLLIVFYQS